MKRKTILKRGRRVALATCCLLAGGAALQSCEDETLTGQPSWLGNSIYERLQEEGSYSTVLHLIDDLDQREVLGHTGSKTLFAADDSAFGAWFKHNDWGVKTYADLTLAQKRLLLNNSMISNAYLIELMSNVKGQPPVEGKAMRRETSSDIYDSVYVMTAEEMPNTPAWAGLKARGKSIPIVKDHTSAPMIHFLPSFMSYNKITAEDLSVLTNGQATSINEAWVNGKRVTERDITCKNGYIQKVDGVVESSPNMAEILRQHPQMSKWSELVDRFSGPYFNTNVNREYQRIYNTEDTVYVLRYLSRLSDGGGSLSVLPDLRTPAKAQLKFDPGWNHYMYKNTMNYDLHYDAGVMIVPTNAALEAWWNNGGKDLQDEYQTWDSIPDQTLAKLINVNMLESFTAAVPSKFDQVLNDAKEVLGIKKEDIDSCFVGCNGIVYLVKKVYTPAEYSSVAYPALAHESTMNVFYWAMSVGSEADASVTDYQVGQMNFLPYLLSMDSRYALIMPTNKAMLQFLDPSTYYNTNSAGDETPQLIEFTYDRSQSMGSRVQAERYNTTVDENGTITKGIRAQQKVADDVIDRMLSDLVNQLIVVIPDSSMTLESYVDRGYSLFKTKGGSLLLATRGANGNLQFEGGWQLQHNHKALETAEVFNKVNGRSYMLDGQMPLTSGKSLYTTLQEHDEYAGFLKLLDNDYSAMLSTQLSGGGTTTYNCGGSNRGNKNFTLFDNFNYTVFVPTTTAIEQLRDNGYLPKDEELLKKFADDATTHTDAAKGLTYTDPLDSICYAERWYEHYARVDDTSSRDSLKALVEACITNVIYDFVRYHVMDRSVAVGMAPEPNFTGNKFESMKRNPETGRFYPLVVDFDQRDLRVTDNLGNSQSVVKTDGLYNNICREYWFKGTGNAATYYIGSHAVAHLINQPLYYATMKPWREVVTDYLTNK